MAKQKTNSAQQSGREQASSKSERQADTSDREIIRIYYAKDESGPAEVLDGLLARIVDVPLLTEEFWRDDIVRLTHLPTDGERSPEIAQVVYTRNDTRSRVEFFGGTYAGTLLMNILSLLRADSAIIVPSVNGKAGLLSVSHHDGFDPADVVKLIGVDKPVSDPDPEEAASSTGRK